jgi:hypothetical protein
MSWFFGLNSPFFYGMERKCNFEKILGNKKDNLKKILN